MKYFSLALLLSALILGSCTKDTGTITMTYQKAKAVYGDIDEVRNQPLIAASRAVIDQGKIHLASDYLYIGEENQGIHVYDNSNPGNAVNLAFIDIPFCKEFIVDGNYIYAESQYDLLKIDISDPLTPTLISRAEEAFYDEIKNENGETLLGFDFTSESAPFDVASLEMDEISETGFLYMDFLENTIPSSAVPASFSGNSSGTIGTVNRISSYDGYVYAVSKRHLSVFSNAGNLTKVGSVNASSNLETIYPLDEYLYVGTNNSVNIYDTRNPQEPVEVSTYEHATSCDPVLPRGNFAYVTLRTGDFGNCPGDVNSLVTLNISNPEQPEELDTREMTSPYGMTVIGDILYVGEGLNGLARFNISTPGAPEYMGTDTSIKAYDVISFPEQNNMILTTGPNGIEQYEYDAETLNLSLIGVIQI